MQNHLQNSTVTSLTPQEISFAIDSPEYVDISRISLLSEVIERPSSISEIARTYQRDAGPLGFQDDEQIGQLQAAGYLVDKINRGDFPNAPWEVSSALSKFGVKSYYTDKVLSDPENDFNLRPTDAGGDSNRMVLYERLGIEPDQVLSPVLSSGSDVVVIQSGDEIVYDKKQKRLKPASNGGRADGWIMKGSGLSEHLGTVGAVADCPMVTLIFTDPNKEGLDAVIATGMMHMGWPNIGNGIDLEMAKVIKKEGLESSVIHASISPGARYGFELPKEVIRLKSKARESFDKQHGDDIFRYGIVAEKEDLVDLDTVKLSAQLLVRNLGVLPDNIFVSDRCTISDPTSHSHRREKGLLLDRPEAGRFAVLSLPAFASRDQYFRDELFGNNDRNTPGLLEQVSDTLESAVYRIR